MAAKKDFDLDRWMEEFYSHPAFATEIKPDAQGEYSPAVQALQALKYADDDEPVVLNIWPLILQYVGAGQTDFISDCDEDEMMSTLLYEVFAEPAPWDQHSRSFRLENVRFFVPLAVANDRQLAEIDIEEQRLRDVLAMPDHVIIRRQPLIQVYTLQHAKKYLMPIGENRFRLC